MTMRTKEKAPVVIEKSVLQAEGRFFGALLKGDHEALASVVADDCILVDVMSGSEVARPEFVAAVGSRRLMFESIERLDTRVRLYASGAIVNGETRLSGRFEKQAFRIHSRYTHVYVRDADGLRLVNAQGTPVVPPASRS